MVDKCPCFFKNGRFGTARQKQQKPAKEHQFFHVGKDKVNINS